MKNTEHTSTILITGITLSVNDEDKIVVLGLVDGIDENHRKSHNFALPWTAGKHLLDSLKDIYESPVEQLEFSKESLDTE